MPSVRELGARRGEIVSGLLEIAQPVSQPHERERIVVMPSWMARPPNVHPNNRSSTSWNGAGTDAGSTNARTSGVRSCATAGPIAAPSVSANATKDATIAAAT